MDSVLDATLVCTHRESCWMHGWPDCSGITAKYDTGVYKQWDMHWLVPVLDCGAEVEWSAALFEPDADELGMALPAHHFDSEIAAAIGNWMGNRHGSDILWRTQMQILFMKKSTDQTQT